MSDEKKIDEIKRLCAEAGLTVAEVLREAKIPYSTVQNWELKDPKPFETERAIKTTLEKMKSEKPKSDAVA